MRINKWCEFCMENWGNDVIEKMVKIDGKGAEKGRKKGEKRPKSGTSGDPSPDQKKHFTPPQKHRKKSGTPTPKSTLQRTKSHPPPGGPPPLFSGQIPQKLGIFHLSSEVW